MIPGNEARIKRPLASTIWLAAFNINDPPTTAATIKSKMNQSPMFLEVIVPSPKPIKKK